MSVYTSISRFHDTYVAQTTLFQKYMMHRLMECMSKTPNEQREEEEEGEGHGCAFWTEDKRVFREGQKHDCSITSFL